MDYINKNTLRIMEVLQEKELYFNEIHEKTGIKSKNNLLKNLGLLFKNNLLNRKANKSNTYYSLNYQNQITLAMLDLINKEKFEKLPFPIKRSILDSIRTTNPKVAILFGSHAKGNYKKDSDIDLILVGSNKDKKKVQEIQEKYGTRINPVFISLEELSSTNESLTHILKTGFPLVGKEYFYEK